MFSKKDNQMLIKVVVPTIYDFVVNNYDQLKLKSVQTGNGFKKLRLTEYYLDDVNIYRLPEGLSVPLFKISLDGAQIVLFVPDVNSALEALPSAIQKIIDAYHDFMAENGWGEPADFEIILKYQKKYDLRGNLY